jgi:hypothetical protein
MAKIGNYLQQLIKPPNLLITVGKIVKWAQQFQPKPQILD